MKKLFLLMTIVLLFLASCNGNEVQKFWNNSLIEKWVTADRYISQGSKDFEIMWLVELYEGISMRAKLKEPIETLGAFNNLDLAYEVTAMLSAPKIKPKADQTELGAIIGYEIDFEFTFFDEDGFIIYEFKPWGGHKSIQHSIYKAEIIFDALENTPEGETKIMVILQNAVPERIAKKTAKIAYKPKVTTLHDNVFRKFRIKKSSNEE